MEHEDERKIREKVRQLEATVVSWDRARVWSSVVAPPLRTTALFVFYYAAASLILAAAVLIYSQQQTHRDELSLRIGEIELALSQTKAAKLETHSISVAEAVECPSAIENSVTMPMTTRNQIKFATKKENRSSKVQLTDSPAVTQVALTETQPQEIVSPPQETVPIPQVALVHESATLPVILGKSIATSSSNQTVTRNHVRIRLFRGEVEPTETSSSPTPVTTLASINNF